MQVNKKLIAQRSAVIFLGVMLFFTFSSRTILYYMTPKVTAARPESGYITTTYSFGNVRTYSEDSFELKLHFRLNQGIYISEVLVGKGSTVREGDPLIIFDKRSCDDLLDAKRRELDAVLIELSEFEKGFADRIAQLENEIESCSKEIAKLDASIEENYVNDAQLVEIQHEINAAQADYETAEKKHGELLELYESGAVPKSEVDESGTNLARLKDRIQLAQERYNRVQKQLLEQGLKQRDELAKRKEAARSDLKYMQDTGIYNGKTWVSIMKRVDEIKGQELELESTVGTYTLTAPFDGVVTEINAEKGMMYYGMDTLVTIRPYDAKTVLLVPLADGQEEIFKENTDCEIEYEEEKIRGKIAGFRKHEGRMHMVLEPVVEAGAELGRGSESGLETGSNTRSGSVSDSGAGAGNGAGSGTEDEAGEGRSRHESSPFAGIRDGSYIRINIKSEFIRTIVPNSAFVSQDKVYVLKQRMGFWGEEYYVVERQVMTGTGNEYVTQITEGLSPDETVVTGWDRKISSGMRVMLPLK